ncbi:Uncharacterised protein [Escherichia coli]|uniref:hypothetical protein n=1 Tax=Escherichia coli TaxID=562 RepID=UPI00191B1A60|nr:hypothetical protein [Escherichia coli]CAD5653024.1 Uncharacterised protein [Escherichia coli]CAD5669169.1 Uncharacterised protein [Escherichia coli]CAD5671019.1 Uncharacterised protein [Escherichia coli]CAD5729003.1 Uncharacterised protein [Escherichia coli]
MAQENSPLSDLFKNGAERLTLLGKHHHALMKGYVDGFIDETVFSEQALKKLIAARIVYRPDEQQPLRLRPLVSELIASMVADESRRQINADVAEKLEQTRNKVQAWRDAYYKGDYSIAERHMQRLTELIHDLSGQFEEAIDSLWHRLNNNFGFVSSLNEKINENARAQNQVRRLLDGLDLIVFQELIEFAENNSSLRKLLVSQLQLRVSLHHSSLLAVQQRLVDLMAKFRQQQSRTLLVTNMAAFLRQHPQYQPGSYPERREVPDVFNIAASLSLQASISLDRPVDRQVMAEMLFALSRASVMPLPVPKSAGSVILPVDEEVAARQVALKMDVEDLYVFAAGQSGPVSALHYLTENHLNWDSEIWLYQVITEYQSLPLADKPRFWQRCDERQASPVNDLRIISDVSIGVRVK